MSFPKERTWRKLVSVFVFLLCFYGVAVSADSAPAPAVANGWVTGRVFCADTGLPARFVTIKLQPEKQSDNSTLDKLDFIAVLAMLRQGSGLSTLTRMDGGFRLENVEPGVYFVIPQFAGYLSPLGQFSRGELINADLEMRKQIGSQVQRIVVQPGQAANVDLRIERGAAISGEVLYSDGTPAVNVPAHLLQKQKEGSWKEISVTTSGVGKVSNATDDRGRYRLAGLPPGEYGVMVELPVTQFSFGAGLASISLQIHDNDALQVFLGNVFRKREMVGVVLDVGEERSGIDLSFPVDGIFKISGSVAAKRDNHTLNSGTVELLDPVDSAKFRTAMVTDDGTFSFEYVPAGDYLLRISAAADIDQNSSSGRIARVLDVLAALPGVGNAVPALGNVLRKHLHDYASADLPLTVHGDMMGVLVAVPEPLAKTP
jgi:hypothetical protein